MEVQGPSEHGRDLGSGRPERHRWKRRPNVIVSSQETEHCEKFGKVKHDCEFCTNGRSVQLGFEI